MVIDLSPDVKISISRQATDPQPAYQTPAPE